VAAADLEAACLPSLLDNARNPTLQPGTPGRIACAQAVPLLDVPAALDRSKGDVHAAGNPHFLPDPLNAKIAAQHICESLCALDSKSCEAYRANLAKFNARLDAKMTEW